MRKSKYRGVEWDPDNNDSMVLIPVNGRTAYMGPYADEEAAAWGYDLLAKTYHGEDARLNFPPEEQA
jgi:hypothetical protein